MKKETHNIFEIPTMLQHLRADCALGQQAACSLQGRMSETHQKVDFKKIVKLTDHTYACNSLTNF